MVRGQYPLQTQAFGKEPPIPLIIWAYISESSQKKNEEYEYVRGYKAFYVCTLAINQAFLEIHFHCHKIQIYESRFPNRAEEIFLSFHWFYRWMTLLSGIFTALVHKRPDLCVFSQTFSYVRSCSTLNHELFSLSWLKRLLSQKERGKKEAEIHESIEVQVHTRLYTFLACINYFFLRS